MQNYEPIWFNQEPGTTDNEPKVNPKIKLFVATPVHSECSIHYTQSLLELQKECWRKKIGVRFHLIKSSLVTQGRNMCVSAFLESDSTHLLFIDSDISFNAGAAERLVACNKDIISIPYPLKDMNWDKALKLFNEGKLKTAQDIRNKAFYRYPMKVPDNNAIRIKDGIIEVTHSPTGFMLIKRKVFTKMIKKYPHLRIDQDQVINGKNERLPHMWNFFDTLFDQENHTYLGEDFAFCKRWKDIGGKCYAWIFDYITHVGEHQYTGRFADELISSDK
jgi:hypothetical protein